MNSTEGEQAEEVPLLRKNFFRLILLSIAGAAIYTLPYFRFSYYDVYLEMYNLTEIQMGALGSAYGLLGLVSYLIGGALADIVSTRKLLFFSLVATGLGGLVHLVTYNFVTLVIIYGMWGITSLLTFWPALIKAVRLLANGREQGRAFGIFEGTRGVVNALFVPIALALFVFVADKIGNFAGIRSNIIFYSSVMILCGLLVLFTIPDSKKVEAREKFKLKNLLIVIKIPQIWLATFILFMAYTYHMSYYYFNPYTTRILGGSIAMGMLMSNLSQWIRPLGCVGGTWLGNRVGNPLVRFLSNGIMAVGTISIILIPAAPTMIPIMVGVVAVIYLSMYAHQALVFPMLAEGKVPMNVSGLAIGLMSTIGYIPEVLVPSVAGAILDKYPGAQGFHYYFGIMAACCTLASIGVLIWLKKYGNKNIPVEPKGAV
ncbi:MAG: MFS transporter [Treponema sp.]|nr:MFS transporter [Treponema sp.]